MTELTLTVKGKITRLRLEPNDKVVVTIERPLAPQDIAEVEQRVKMIFPEHQVVMMAPGLQISALSGDVDVAGGQEAS